MAKAFDRSFMSGLCRSSAKGYCKPHLAQMCHGVTNDTAYSWELLPSLAVTHVVVAVVALLLWVIVRSRSALQAARREMAVLIEHHEEQMRAAEEVHVAREAAVRAEFRAQMAESAAEAHMTLTDVTARAEVAEVALAMTKAEVESNDGCHTPLSVRSGISVAHSINLSALRASRASHDSYTPFDLDDSESTRTLEEDGKSISSAFSRDVGAGQLTTIPLSRSDTPPRPSSLDLLLGSSKALLPVADSLQPQTPPQTPPRVLRTISGIPCGPRPTPTTAQEMAAGGWETRSPPSPRSTKRLSYADLLAREQSKDHRGSIDPLAAAKAKAASEDPQETAQTVA